MSRSHNLRPVGSFKPIGQLTADLIASLLAVEDEPEARLRIVCACASLNTAVRVLRHTEPTDFAAARGFIEDALLQLDKAEG